MDFYIYLHIFQGVELPALPGASYIIPIIFYSFLRSQVLSSIIFHQLEGFLVVQVWSWSTLLILTKNLFIRL